MTKLSKQVYGETYLALFQDNNTGEISEADIRKFVEDTRDTFRHEDSAGGPGAAGVSDIRKATYSLMLAEGPYLDLQGILVADATADPTVEAGAAYYKYNLATNSFEKISEAESMDLLLSGFEPAILPATAADYWAGDKTWKNFAAAVLAILQPGNPDGVISGGTSTFAGLVETLAPTSWRIANTMYATSTATQFTHVADQAYDRINTVIAKNDGSLELVQGIPAVNPQKIVLAAGVVAVNFTLVRSNGTISSTPVGKVKIADVDGLQEELNKKEDKTAKGAANGYTPLGADQKVPAEYLPATQAATGLEYTFTFALLTEAVDLTTDAINITAISKTVGINTIELNTNNNGFVLLTVPVTTPVGIPSNASLIWRITYTTGSNRGAFTIKANKA